MSVTAKREFGDIADPKPALQPAPTVRQPAGTPVERAILRGEAAFRQWEAPKLDLLLETAIADLTALRSRLPETFVRASRDVDDGLASSPLDGGTRSSGVSDPTGRRATPNEFGRNLLSRDGVRPRVEKMIASIEASCAMAGLALREQSHVLPLGPEQVAVLIGDAKDRCTNCGASFTRIGNDRPRAGRCLDCYTPWKATGVDRSKDEIEAKVYKKGR